MIAFGYNAAVSIDAPTASSGSLTTTDQANLSTPNLQKVCTLAASGMSTDGAGRYGYVGINLNGGLSNVVGGNAMVALLNATLPANSKIVEESDDGTTTTSQTLLDGTPVGRRGVLPHYVLSLTGNLIRSSADFQFRFYTPWSNATLTIGRIWASPFLDVTNFELAEQADKAVSFSRATESAAGQVYGAARPGGRVVGVRLETKPGDSIAGLMTFLEMSGRSRHVLFAPKAPDGIGAGSLLAANVCHPRTVYGLLAADPTIKHLGGNRFGCEFEVVEST